MSARYLQPRHSFQKKKTKSDKSAWSIGPYVLIQRNRDDPFVHCFGCFLRLGGNNRRGGGWWWRRRRRRRGRFKFWLRFGFGFRRRFGRVDRRDVRRGEKPTTRSVCAPPKPPVRIFLYDLHNELALDEGQLVIFCGLRNDEWVSAEASMANIIGTRTS